MIHQSAIVDKSCIIGKNVNIGAYSIIEPNVILEDNVNLGNNCLIYSGSRIGNSTNIASFCSIGSMPNIYGIDANVKSGVIIGENNTICDAAIICRAKESGKYTKFGSNNHIGPGAYIGHDGQIENNVIVSAYARISGFVKIADKAHIGMNAFIHQFSNIGQYAMIGAMSKIVRDILPYTVADGNPAMIKKINSTGLKRNSFSESDIKSLESFFLKLKTTPYPDTATNDRFLTLNEFKDNNYTNSIILFINNSSRGCCALKKQELEDE